MSAATIYSVFVISVLSLVPVTHDSILSKTLEINYNINRLTNKVTLNPAKCSHGVTA